MAISIEPIGRVNGGRAEPIDDQWDQVRCEIVLDAAQFTPDALAGLDAFSHLEVLFHFDQVGIDEITTAARHPRGRTDWPKVGIFAQRGKNRPNRLGISVCKLIAVDGLVITVEGLDAIHGSPILDIKPVMKGFLPRGEVHQPDWADEIMAEYW
jgi:tRNA-Thr(GGU) m(6)t(6)A37 methyltransferase TsaA